MKAMKGMPAKPRRNMKMAMPERFEMMMRRSANRNAHVITPHGKLMKGRKGRTM